MSEVVGQLVAGRRSDVRDRYAKHRRHIGRELWRGDGVELLQRRDPVGLLHRLESPLGLVEAVGIRGAGRECEEGLAAEVGRQVIRQRRLSLLELRCRPFGVGIEVLEKSGESDAFLPDNDRKQPPIL